MIGRQCDRWTGLVGVVTLSTSFTIIAEKMLLQYHCGLANHGVQIIERASKLHGFSQAFRVASCSDKLSFSE